MRMWSLGGGCLKILLAQLSTNAFAVLYPLTAVLAEQIKYIAFILYFCYFLYQTQLLLWSFFCPLFPFSCLSFILWRLMGCSSSVISGQTVWPSLSRSHLMSELALDVGNYRSIWFCIKLKKDKWSLNLINIPFLELLMESIDKVKVSTVLDLHSHTNRYYSLICTGDQLVLQKLITMYLS